MYRCRSAARAHPRHRRRQPRRPQQQEQIAVRRSPVRCAAPLADISPTLSRSPASHRRNTSLRVCPIKVCRAGVHPTPGPGWVDTVTSRRSGDDMLGQRLQLPLPPTDLCQNVAGTSRLRGHLPPRHPRASVMRLSAPVPPAHSRKRPSGVQLRGEWTCIQERAQVRFRHIQALKQDPIRAPD